MHCSVKRLFSFGLALVLCLSVGAESVFAVDTGSRSKKIEIVSDAKEIAEVINDHWDKSYFGEVVIDPEKNVVTQDGTSTTLQKALDVDAQDTKQVLKSADAAEDYFADTVYESETQKNGDVVVTAPFQTMRIVVITQSLSNTYGAKKTLYYPNYHEYILQYDTQEAAQNAYDKLVSKYGEKCCFTDELLSSEDMISDTGTESGESVSCYSWGARMMGLDRLKEEVEKSAGKVTVAIVDTGIDVDNQFFSGRTITSNSYNFMEDSKDISDATGHGTHVAGIVADCTPQNVQLMILRVFSVRKVNGEKREYSTTLAINTALQYAITCGADVINMSAGWSGIDANSYTFLDETIHAAYRAKIPMFNAAGNNKGNVAYSYPACNSETIAISAINSDKSFAEAYSKRGSRIDFAAPGTDISSAKASGGICFKSGTSMAAPHMAAAAAYIKLQDPSASVANVYAVLKRYTVDLGKKGKDDLYGWGYVNLSNYYDNDPGGAHDLSNMSVTLSRSSYTCDGTAKKPKVTVKENGKVVSPYNYNIAYQNNVKVGTAKVTVTGIGNYKGKLTKSFSIRLGTPSRPSATNGTKGIAVKWKRVTGATGYCVFRKTGGSSSWKKVQTIRKGSAKSWTDKKSKNGKKYTYAVRAYYGRARSTSKGSKWILRLSRPSISNMKNSRSRKMTVTWKKNSKASGYQILYGTRRSLKGGKKVSITSRTSKKKTLSRLTKKKYYFVRIRSYKRVSGTKYYSAWSTEKAVKIKK